MIRTTHRAAAAAGLTLTLASAGLLFAGPALADGLAAPVLTPSSVAAGNTSFAITGEGCVDTDPSDGFTPAIMLTVGDLVIENSVEPEVDGSWAGTVQLTNITAGTYAVIASCDGYYYSEPTTYPAVTLTVTGAAGPTATPAAPTAGLAEATDFTMKLDGFKPYEKVHVVLNSTPLDLGFFTADANGVITIRATIPAGFALGAHSLVMTGDLGTSRTVAVTLTADGAVAPVTASDVLAYTGASTALPLALGSGLLLAGAGAMVVSRRRRPTQAAQV